MASAAALYALTNAIQPVLRAWGQAANIALADSGLAPPLAKALLLACRLGDGIQQSVLAEEIGVNPGALVRTLDQAEAAGLLQRREVPHNRRARAIYVLAEGRRIALHMEAALEALRAELFEGLSESEVVSATRVLRLLEQGSIDYHQHARSRK
ncbi:MULTISPECIES: MarR family winged helix-turn-helix transcriptional regulator [Halopseudomonas]|uniref:MarR family transcriptional regulator, transcriptional regulator for hemolysin n=1 Tax=Halopseudomonas litoralis TaxID=797277 RepID=A0A1H1MTC9_9GAMM|nr:MarR family transcriptional regulator [Halopseudomonas litoralis]SDR90014.1 MarR family transcriptional regulator, transcriptional regulator for hemolysin [Halopseudomonas litoralis]|tara:strand:+ start:361 stop:822 length:462 start_codon:yes stop_codon:yes gene_type:complete